MSDSAASSPSTPNELLFPAFMFGEKTPCRRKMKAEAKKWAKYYLAGRPFPEPKLVPIAPGSIVFTDESTADLVRLGYNFIPHTNIVFIDGHVAKLQGLHIQWRIYLLDDLQFEAKQSAKLSREEGFAFLRVFVPFVCKYAWGAISMVGALSLYNSIPLTMTGIAGVLRHWDALDTLKYIIVQTTPVSLTELMDYYFRGSIDMWVEKPTGNIRTDLQTAIEQMGQASPEQIHTRLLRRLRECVDSTPDLKHRDWLKSPGIIEGALEARRRRGQEFYDDLTSGRLGGHQGLLKVLVRDEGPDAERTSPPGGDEP